MVGYRIQNQDSLNSVYNCSYCSLLLRDPVQIIDCGHRICQSCADEQQGDLIKCSTCQEETSRKNLIIDRGFKKDMQDLWIVCVLCTWADILKNFEDHLNHTHPNPNCGYCGENFSSIHDLNRHQIYTCEKITVYCSLKEFGCTKMILRPLLNEHYRSEEHQKSLINVVIHLASINHSKSSSNMTTNTTEIVEITGSQLQEIDETANTLSDGAKILNDDRERLVIEATAHQNALDSLMNNLSILKTSVEEQNSFLESTKMNQEILLQDVTSMKQKVNEQTTCSYDGTFIWKIINVQEKIAAAKAEVQTSIYSSPFYTSPTGYKMCLRLYPCGDGNARQTHMSLFFVLMRGEYDPILKFPFSYKVIFCLYDQTKQQNHIIDAFRPDVRSNSFQRPRSEMNIASGIPKFAALTLFEDANNPYVLDDTMLIKVIIDFLDMPKNMLAYALSLNPGLTTSMHHTIIREEIEKRKQQQSATTLETHTDVG